MQIKWWNRFTSRTRWIAAFALITLVVVALWWFPGGLRRPESMARNFLETLVRTPDNTTQLRAVANVPEEHDPHSLVEALSAKVTLDFLRTREKQGIGHTIRVIDSPKTAPPRYVVIVQVTEDGDRNDLQTRRFHVVLQDDMGTWRVTAVNTAP